MTALRFQTRGETSDIPGLPSGVARKCAKKKKVKKKKYSTVKLSQPKQNIAVPMRRVTKCENFWIALLDHSAVLDSIDHWVSRESSTPFGQTKLSLGKRNYLNGLDVICLTAVCIWPLCSHVYHQVVTYFVISPTSSPTTLSIWPPRDTVLTGGMNDNYSLIPAFKWMWSKKKKKRSISWQTKLPQWTRCYLSDRSLYLTPLPSRVSPSSHVFCHKPYLFPQSNVFDCIWYFTSPLNFIYISLLILRVLFEQNQPVFRFDAVLQLLRKTYSGCS